MRPAFATGMPPTYDFLLYAKQFGVKDILLHNTDGIPGYDGKWAIKDLAMMRLDIESHGMRLAAIENVPVRFYEDIMIGGPKRDEQIENMIITIRNMARAGIRIFGYHWMPSLVWRTTPKTIRGGALATAFNWEEAKDLPLTHGRVYTEEEMWENLEYWLKIIIPIAEEEDIRMGIHPCDPPVKEIGGVPQLFSSYDNYPALPRYLRLPLQRHRVLPGHGVRDVRFRRRQHLSLHRRNGPSRPDLVRSLPQCVAAQSQRLQRGVHQHRPRRHVPGDEDLPRCRIQELLHRRPCADHAQGHTYCSTGQGVRQRLHPGHDRSGVQAVGVDRLNPLQSDFRLTTLRRKAFRRLSILPTLVGAGFKPALANCAGTPPGPFSFTYVAFIRPWSI